MYVVRDTRNNSLHGEYATREEAKPIRNKKNFEHCDGRARNNDTSVYGKDWNTAGPFVVSRGHNHPDGPSF